jgi:HD-GYP domain-containing protein (c-di-GMP phosphodiesterase class II)
VLAPVSRHGDLYGWVAALNRLGPSAVARQGEIPWWGLSDLEFGSTEAGLLVSASAIFAACARNVDLIRQKENLLVGVVRALVSAIEARDRYTFGHSERVALTSQRLGEQLGLSRQHCRRLYLTGLLHDIGKIGVSDQVLRKPGQLTRSEQEQVKQHTQLGYAILHDLDQLAFVLPGVLHHHERFDGKGYPNGFVGEQIPLDARIIAVADAYDAMISNRPYREGMSDSQAELCLRAGAAVQWDASVVEALFEAHDDIRAIIRGYQPPAPLVNGQLWVDGQRCADNQQWADGQLCASTAARTCLASLDLSDVVLSTLPPP